MFAPVFPKKIFLTNVKNEEAPPRPSPEGRERRE